MKKNGNIQYPEVESLSWPLDPMSGKRFPAGAQPFKRFFVVKQLDGDTLVCADERGRQYYVSLPFTMQKYFFERTYISDRTAFHDGMYYKWGTLSTTTNDDDEPVSWQQERTVTNYNPDEDAPEEGAVIRTEKVTPAYVKGEPIIAMHFINDKDRSIKWVDMNIAGRVFKNESVIEIMTLVSEASSEYIICEDSSGSQIRVAKPYIFQENTFSDQESDGITYDVSGTDRRTATQGEYSETQIITPSYFEGEKLAVVKVSPTDLDIAECEYIDLNIAGRCWASLPIDPVDPVGE